MTAYFLMSQIERLLFTSFATQLTLHRLLTVEQIVKLREALIVMCDNALAECGRG